jgi:cell division transport system permease protein
MLKKTKSLFAHHLQAAKYSLDLLCFKPFATMMTLIVIAIALALPALFWVFSDNLSQLTLSWQKAGHISLYLKPSLQAADEQAVLKTVLSTQGVGQATLKSAGDGLKELTKQEGMQDIMRYLPENPLPGVIDITPSLTIDTEAKLELLSQQFKSIESIEHIKLDMQWVGRLHAVLGFISTAAHALLVLLALAVLLIIGNALRIEIHNRADEIQVLKLIGATDSYILRPFLYSGIVYGLLGSILAILFVTLFLLSLEIAANTLVVVYEMHYPSVGLSIRQILLLALFAIILGWFGARCSVKRQLAATDPWQE